MADKTIEAKRMLRWSDYSLASCSSAVAASASSDASILSRRSATVNRRARRSIGEKASFVIAYSRPFLGQFLPATPGVKQQAVEFARTIPPSDRKPVTVDGMKQWYLSVCVKMPNIGHKVRVVILWRYKNDAKPRKILVTNKIHWNAERIVTTYRGRWTGTETFHRDGKQELGLGDCQLRDGVGQTRHTYCVFLAYSLLMRDLDKTSVSGRSSARRTTIGESCRALLRESVWNLIGWIVEQLEAARSLRGNVAKRLEAVFHRLRLSPHSRR